MFRLLAVFKLQHVTLAIWVCKYKRKNSFFLFQCAIIIRDDTTGTFIWFKQIYFIYLMTIDVSRAPLLSVFCVLQIWKHEICFGVFVRSVDFHAKIWSTINCHMTKNCQTNQHVPRTATKKVAELSYWTAFVIRQYILLQWIHVMEYT